MWYYIILSYLLGLGMFNHWITIILSPISVPIKIGRMVSLLSSTLYYLQVEDEEEIEDHELSERPIYDN